MTRMWSTPTAEYTPPTQSPALSGRRLALRWLIPGWTRPMTLWSGDITSITSGSALLSSFKQLSSTFPGLANHPLLHFVISIPNSRYLWKVSESGRVNMLVQDMNVPMVDKDQKEDRKKVLVDYFLEDRHNHELYAYTFFACEFLNFVNVLLQLLFMDFFLGGEFTTYGSDVISMTNLEQEQRSDPLSRVFPKVTCFNPVLSFITTLRSSPILSERLN